MNSATKIVIKSHQCYSLYDFFYLFVFIFIKEKRVSNRLLTRLEYFLQQSVWL